MENTADRRRQEDFKLESRREYTIDWSLVKTTKQVVIILKAIDIRVHTDFKGNLPPQFDEVVKLGYLKKS